MKKEIYINGNHYFDQKDFIKSFFQALTFPISSNDPTFDDLSEALVYQIHDSIVIHFQNFDHILFLFHPGQNYVQDFFENLSKSNEKLTVHFS